MIFKCSLLVAATLALNYPAVCLACWVERTDGQLAASPPRQEIGPAHHTSLPLDDIQDVAFTLQRIRQQAINIFVEATRKKRPELDLNVPNLNSIPDLPLENQSAYLPLRKAWLVFFIGAMEPLVHLLEEDLQDVEEETAKLKIPENRKGEWDKLVSDWKTSVHGLNKHLNECAALLDETSDGNVEVAKIAIAIDKQISHLDGLLHQGCKFLNELASDKQ